MKCPGCGAEIGDSKVCDFCGTRIAANLQLEEQKTQEQLNKQGCPKCGSTNIEFKRENMGEVRGKDHKRVVHTTVGYCKDCGYTWYPQGETVQVPTKRRTWLWVLGWICCFPIPLTILMLRKKDMKPILKYGIIALAWILYIGIGATGNTGGSGSSSADGSASVWKEGYSALEEFDYYIDGDEIYLKDYNGSDKKVRISPTYNVDGTDCKVVALTDGTFALGSIESAIIPEGVKSIENNTFNSCGVRFVYLPASLEEISSSFLGYFHDADTIYYGGSEDQWNSLVDRERGDIDAKQIKFDANPDELK